MAADLLVLIASPLAHAGIPVVHEGGDPVGVVAAVAGRSGLPAEQLEAIDVSELARRPPSSLGDAVVRRCAGAVTRMAAVEAELVRAEAALGADDTLRAIDHLDLAVGQLGCLTEVVEPKRVSLGFLLRGALAAEAGREEEARGEVRTSLAFDPDVVWPAHFPSAGQSLLAQELQHPTSHALSIVPARGGTGPWVDGQQIDDTATVRSGLHLAQYGGTGGIASSWLVVGADAELVLPDRFVAPVLNGFADGSTRADIERLLAATLTDFEAAYVTHRSGIWLVSRGQGASLQTTELAPAVAPEPEPAPEPDGKKGKRPRKGTP